MSPRKIRYLKRKLREAQAELKEVRPSYSRRGLFYDRDDFEELWIEALEAGSTIYDVVSFDYGSEMSENMGNAQVVQHPSGRWLYVDDVDGYDWISKETINDWFDRASDVTLVPA